MYDARTCEEDPRKGHYFGTVEKFKKKSYTLHRFDSVLSTLFPNFMTSGICVWPETEINIQKTGHNIFKLEGNKKPFLYVNPYLWQVRLLRISWKTVNPFSRNRKTNRHTNKMPYAQVEQRPHFALSIQCVWFTNIVCLLDAFRTRVLR